MATKAKIIQFLLSGYNDPTTDLPLAAGTVDVTVGGTSNTAYVWDDRDKTLPTTTGRSTITLDSAGRAEVYGDGIYKFVIKDSTGATVETIDNFEVLSINGSVSSVDTKANLALLTTSGLVDGTSVYIEGGTAIADGAEGLFRWDSSDLSANVAADTGEGVYIAPNGEDGSSGAWVRYIPKGDAINMEWWPGSNHTTDWTEALNVAGDEDTILFPGSAYTITSMDVTKNVTLRGNGRQGTTITLTSSALDSDVSERYALRLIGLVSDGLNAVPKMWGMSLVSTDATAGVNGILVRRKSILEDVYISGATQDGIQFNTDTANNASFFSRFTDVWSKSNGRYGCNVQKGANANVFINCQWDSNTSDGFIHQTGGIATNGNVLIGGQASFNGDRGYNFSSGTEVQMVGGYSETNGSELTAPAWATATGYTAGDLVTSPSSGLTNAQTSVVYQAASNHTSDASSFETDYNLGLWEPYGTEMRVSNSLTFSNIHLGLAIGAQTHRVRNESTQISTKVGYGGFWVKQKDNSFPIFQGLQLRDGLNLGQNSGSVTQFVDVGGGGEGKIIFREGNTEIFSIEYAGTPANPANLLKIRSGTAGTIDTDCIVVEQDGGIQMPNLPTAAPATSGSLWVDTSAGRVVKHVA